MENTIEKLQAPLYKRLAGISIICLVLIISTFAFLIIPMIRATIKIGSVSLGEFFEILHQFVFSAEKISNLTVIGIVSIAFVFLNYIKKQTLWIYGEEKETQQTVILTSLNSATQVLFNYVIPPIYSIWLLVTERFLDFFFMLSLLFVTELIIKKFITDFQKVTGNYEALKNFYFEGERMDFTNIQNKDQFIQMLLKPIFKSFYTLASKTIHLLIPLGFVSIFIEIQKLNVSIYFLTYVFMILLGFYWTVTLTMLFNYRPEFCDIIVDNEKKPLRDVIIRNRSSKDEWLDILTEREHFHIRREKVMIIKYPTKQKNAENDQKGQNKINPQT